MHADVPTMLLMIIISSVAMALALAVVAWGQRRDGIAWWATGLLLHALGYVLFSGRGRIPDGLSIVLANALLACSLSALQAAVHQFMGRPWPRWHMAVPAAFIARVMWALIDHYPLRVATASLCYAVQIGLLLAALRPMARPGAGRGVLLLGLGLGVQMMVLLLRAAMALWGQQHPSGLLASDLVQSLTFLMSFLTVQLASLGFVFMTRDRLDEGNRRLATTDALTGVANRRSAIFALERDAARAQRMGGSVALMVVDIDHFKRINDSHGHLAGDRVLCHVVNVLSDRVRTQDLVGRYGGEEFLVLLPDTGLDGALVLAEQLRQSVQQSVCHWQGQALAVTVSIGVFGGRLGSGDTWEMVLDAADRALYQAKQAGRNQVQASNSLARAEPHSMAAPEPSTQNI